MDAGLRGSGQLLRWYLSRIGRATRDITRIVCSHGHPDHIGGVREIAEMSGAEVLMHPADTERLRIGLREALADRRPSAIVAALTTGPEDARPLVDGQEVMDKPELTEDKRVESILLNGTTLKMIAAALFTVKSTRTEVPR